MIYKLVVLVYSTVVLSRD